MKILIACEFSGAVRDAFAALGHEAWSSDLLPSETSGNHYQGDVRDILDRGWDLMIAHPPCTHLAVSGARHFAAKQASGVQQEALEFVRELLDAPIPRIALENPISIISSRIRKPDQIIQPWQFGHGETKATCLWLKNLPKLTPTNVVDGREPRVHMMPPGPNRWKERSRTFEGIASAMADQWGKGPCAKQTTRATIITKGGERFVGENDCRNPQVSCAREGLATGVGYELCKSVCQQTAHAEVNACIRAGEKARGATLYLEGHYYACDACLKVCREHGLAEVVMAPPPSLTTKY